MDVTELIPSDSRVDGARQVRLYGVMCDLWRLERRDASHNPCALAVPLERRHTEMYKASDYLLVPKTDGVRQLLMLTVEEGRNIAVMIGRDMQMYEIEVWAPTTFFKQGTLLDGELAWDNDAQMRMIYHCFDAMMVEGEPVAKAPLVDRLQTIIQCLDLSEHHNAELQRYMAEQDDQYLSFIPESGKIVATHNNSYGLVLRPKTMLTPAEWAKTTAGERWCDAAFAGDGLVFTPRELPVFVNTHRQLFKWKPNEALTVDFLADGQKLSLLHGTRPREVTVLLGCAVRLAEVVDRAIYECTMTREGDVIMARPLRRRNDKQAPNTIETATATLNILADNLTVAELRAWCAAS